jgi:hypothetical protein
LVAIHFDVVPRLSVLWPPGKRRDSGKRHQ